jgi:beta-phosphoglucomutase-like phosphatase (HAD superfamily)
MKKIIPAYQAIQKITQQAQEFAVIQNPAGIWPSVEYVPLAEKLTGPLSRIKAVVSDMDGTTTTTEGLCIHALEYMVRQITGRLDPSQWSGLDPDADYPHIIGNSTTRHVEYLMETYHPYIRPESLKESFLKAALWFLWHGQDAQRKQEVRQNLIALNCQPLLDFAGNLEKEQADIGKTWNKIKNDILKSCFRGVKSFSDAQTVKMAVDIYYQRYHEILAAIDDHTSIPGLDDSRELIEPMPGIGIYLALIKGLLGDEIEKLVPELKKAFEEKSGSPWEGGEDVIPRLVQVSRFFEKNPVKIAIVTSSIFYEARIVMSRVFERLRRDTESWPLSEARKSRIMDSFTAYENVYDAFVTASDSNEIRLKPHRDLYSIALHQLGIPKEDFDTVIGFEDSESGTLAIRAAGIGLCCAVPFHETSGHDLSAASHILQGGIPEAILKHLAFIKTGA